MTPDQEDAMTFREVARYADSRGLLNEFEEAVLASESNIATHMEGSHKNYYL